VTYETVIGLEVHVELSTASKIFCGCPVTYGQEPNTKCCPVCTGLPGALPVLNKNVVEYALRTCLAVNCEISRITRFDRKNYFYPDLPKAYQISQLYQPIGRNGWLDIEVNGTKRRVRIHELHMEEDAGKLMHDPWEDQTLVDYNRCGVPLLEIVSEPDLRSAEEALTYLEQLRGILQFIGVSDCRMEEGSLRADVNVSLRPAGSNEFGTRTEMKNMNSFKAIGRAIEKESLRQIELLNEGGRVIQETRRWDENKDASFPMRSKEDAHDYRYFPDPDLTAVHVSEDWIDQVRRELPELPADRRKRYIGELGLSDYEAQIVTGHPVISGLFEDVYDLTKLAKDTASWIMGEYLQLLKDKNCGPENLSLSAEDLAAVVSMTAEGKVNRVTARKVLVAVIEDGVKPQTYIEQHGLAMVSDASLLEDTVRQVLAENPRSIEDYKNGKKKAAGFLVGQAMRALGGKADPQLLGSIINRQLSEA
jgi:aspartyl-tRNA(Asn)/glutamyl-tRNA(Gln) amidotransferase subunit B